jgi:hypothetical protein
LNSRELVKNVSMPTEDIPFGCLGIPALNCMFSRIAKVNVKAMWHPGYGNFLVEPTDVSMSILEAHGLAARLGDFSAVELLILTLVRSIRS